MLFSPGAPRTFTGNPIRDAIVLEPETFAGVFADVVVRMIVELALTIG